MDLPIVLFCTYAFINFGVFFQSTRLFGLHVYSVPESSLRTTPRVKVAMM